MTPEQSNTLLLTGLYFSLALHNLSDMPRQRGFPRAVSFLLSIAWLSLMVVGIAHLIPIR